jgi:hypothetical protein
MSTYPYMVQIEWDVVNQFVRDWQMNPYLWNKEIDVQMKLAGRLSSVLKILGRGTMEARYEYGPEQFSMR